MLLRLTGSVFRRCPIYVRQSIRRFDGDEFIFWLLPLWVITVMVWMILAPIPG